LSYVVIDWATRAKFGSEFFNIWNQEPSFRIKLKGTNFLAALFSEVVRRLACLELLKLIKF
jgi:hypothetical protein